jgi:hypothetical protein
VNYAINYRNKKMFQFMNYFKIYLQDGIVNSGCISVHWNKRNHELLSELLSSGLCPLCYFKEHAISDIGSVSVQG